MGISEFSFEEFVAQGHERRRACDKGGSLAAFQAAHRLQPNHLGAQLEVINGLRDLMRFEEAAAMAQQVIAQHPKTPAPYISLGLLKRHLKDGAAAVAAFEEAIGLAPDHPGAHLELASELRALGEIERADTIIENISQRRPDVAGVQAAVGMLKRRLGDRRGSLAAFRAASSIDPNFVGAHLEMANDLRELGELDEAEAVLREVLSRYPMSAAAWTSLGLIARRRGDHEAALASLARAADIDPENIGAQLERANELRCLNRIPEAEKCLWMLLNSHPTHPAPLIGLAQLKRQQGDRLSSLATFQSAAKLDPTDVIVTVEIATDLRELRRYAEAELVLQEALSSHPNDARVLGAMGQVKRRRGDRSASLAMFEAAASAEPKNFYLQLECANDLRDLGRFAEAERVLRQVVLERPQEAMPLVVTAHLHRRRGNTTAALDLLRSAATKDPSNLPLKMEIVQSAIELGQLDEAAQILCPLLAGGDADDPTIVLKQAQLLRARQRRRESLNYLESVSQRNPTEVSYLIEMATDELSLGHPDRAVALNEQALALEPANLPALLQAFHFAAIAGHWDAAAEMCLRATKAHPGTSGPRTNAARAAFELGRREEAFAIIREAREQLGALPEFSMREAELLRLMRDWTAVRKIVARERQSESGATFALLVHLVQVEILTGNFDRARAELSAMRPSTLVERASHANLAGLLAEAKFQYAMAATHYRSAIELNPADPSLRLDLARVCLVTLNLDGCQQELSAFTRLSQSSALRQGLSPKLRHNFIGQLLDEFRLESEALARLLKLRSFSDERQLPLLRELVKSFPDYTAGALVAIAMLRKTGHFDDPIDPLGPSIPRRIVQYWNDTPPSDVLDLMISWQRHNPSYEWQCVDNDDAEDFLATYFPSRVAEAYKAACEPAQKADLFRLAWLAKNGGIYVDADDACTGPIDCLTPNGGSLVLYQENYGSIANNFIAAIPDHPVILAALELAVQALLRGDHDMVWLSTGPGLLTRAFAQHWAACGDSSVWLKSVSVMTLGEIQRVVAVHCHARYKSTPRSWTRASFVRSSRKNKERLGNRVANGQASRLSAIAYPTKKDNEPFSTSSF